MGPFHRPASGRACPAHHLSNYLSNIHLSSLLSLWTCPSDMPFIVKNLRPCAPKVKDSRWPAGEVASPVSGHVPWEPDNYPQVLHADVTTLISHFLLWDPFPVHQRP